MTPLEVGVKHRDSQVRDSIRRYERVLLANLPETLTQIVGVYDS